MTTTAAYAFSEHGLNPFAVIDHNSLDVFVRYRRETRRVVVGSTEAAAGVFVQNTTKKHNLGPVGDTATLAYAFISSATTPAGGSLTYKLVAYDASANAEVVLSATQDAESLVAREAGIIAMTSTNVELVSEDTIELHCIADNNTVTTDASQVSVTLIWFPSQPSVHYRGAPDMDG